MASIKQAFARAAAKHPAADLKTVLADAQFQAAAAALGTAVTYVNESHFLLDGKTVDVATSGPADRRHRVISTRPCPECGSHFVPNDACDLCGGQLRRFGGR